MSTISPCSSTTLTESEEEKLLEIMRKYKEAIA